VKSLETNLCKPVENMLKHVETCSIRMRWPSSFHTAVIYALETDGSLFEKKNVLKNVF